MSTETEPCRTQLVELQSFLPTFQAAGVAVFVVFPESVAHLQKFATAFDITIPLLADPDSTIIREVGILNTTLTESDAPFYGIPYPGSYVIGADGQVIAKFFEQNSLVRPTPSSSSGRRPVRPSPTASWNHRRRRLPNRSR